MLQMLVAFICVKIQFLSQTTVKQIENAFIVWELLGLRCHCWPYLVKCARAAAQVSLAEIKLRLSVADRSYIPGWPN